MGVRRSRPQLPKWEAQGLSTPKPYFTCSLSAQSGAPRAKDSRDRAELSPSFLLWSSGVRPGRQQEAQATGPRCLVPMGLEHCALLGNLKQAAFPLLYCFFLHKMRV